MKCSETSSWHHVLLHGVLQHCSVNGLLFMGVLKCRPVLWEVAGVLIWGLSVVSKGTCASEVEISETCRLLELCLLGCYPLKLTEHFAE